MQGDKGNAQTGGRNETHEQGEGRTKHMKGRWMEKCAGERRNAWGRRNMQGGQRNTQKRTYFKIGYEKKQQKTQ